MLSISGTFSATCSKCGSINKFIPEDTNFIAEPAEEEKPMGPAMTYTWEKTRSCVECGEEIDIVYVVTEYPKGTLETDNVTVDRHNVTSRFNYAFELE